MVQLWELKERYGLSQMVALGGTEARKAIAQIRPEGIVAVACERDLLVGIKDLRGRIPVLAFTTQRPEGPCKNTLVDIEEIEHAIRLFLGKPTDDTVKKQRRRKDAMKVTIDAGLCTGCSLCVTDVPEVFEMGDDGLAKVLVESPDGELAEKAKDEALNCPAAAILIEE